MVKILRVFSRLNIGGPSIHVVLLTAEMQACGYDTRLVVGRESRSEGNMIYLAERYGVTPVQIQELGRAIHPWSDALAFKKIYQLIREFRPDVVHTHTAKAGVLGRVAAWMLDVPVIVHTFHGHVFHSYFGNARSAFFRWIERVLSRMSTRIIAISDNVKQDLMLYHIAPPEKIVVVPLGLDLDSLLSVEHHRGTFRKELGLGPNDKLVGIVGRVVKVKNLEIAVKAAERVIQRLPATHFAMVGDGDEKENLVRLIAQRGLERHITLLGWRRDLENIYSDCDLALNTSLNEGTPVALIEAMAAGLPTVATNVGGTANVVVQDVTGYLCPSGDAEALAAAMINILGDQRRAREMGRAGRERVRQRFSKQRLVRDLDSLYTNLLSKGEGFPAEKTA
ncbi:MAG: glycosyltransferase family 4 protein [Acidobacteriia bacterium]|nr:glycosyltransferase family 4 protein [Terriglobia bacterium]